MHEGLLVLRGKRAKDVVFVDREGRPLHEEGQLVSPQVIQALRRQGDRHLDPAKVPTADAPADRGDAAATVTLSDVPDVVDGSWWRRHAHLIHLRADRGLSFRPGHPTCSTDAEHAAVPDAEHAAVPGAEHSAVSGAEHSAPARQASEHAAPAGAEHSAPFAHLFGQEGLVARLQLALEGSHARGRPLPHLLLSGPAGAGKTSIARAFARAAGARLVETNGPLVQDVPGVLRLLAELREGDALFVDEIHALPRPVMETLYQALAERHLTLTFHEGARARSVGLELPSFTLLGATTEAGALPEALISRFGLHETLGWYAEEDLAAIAVAKARTEGHVLTRAAARKLADFGRGTPRETLRLLDRVLDHVASRGKQEADADAVAQTLARLGYDEEGLCPLDQRYLGILRESRGAVSLARIAKLLGTNVRTVLDRIEPFLFRRGLVRMTSRGRVAAWKAQSDAA